MLTKNLIYIEIGLVVNIKNFIFLDFIERQAIYSNFAVE